MLAGFNIGGQLGTGPTERHHHAEQRVCCDREGTRAWGRTSDAVGTPPSRIVLIN